MAQLQAHIDWTCNTITFSGPGTFQAKEQIKSLGRAQWRGDLKSWIVTCGEISVEHLKEVFPQLDISESGAGSDPLLQSKPAAAAPAQLQPAPQEGRGRADAEGVPPGLGVAQLLAQVRLALAKSFPQPVFVKGIISKIKSPRHTYIELADAEDGSVHVSCFIWSDDAPRICGEVEKAGFALETELEVMFEAEVGLNPRRGEVSLTVRRVVVEYTIGKLAAERDKTNERLKKEGLFEKNKLLKLPFIPSRLGLITSKAGTVINDFRDSLDAARFSFWLLWHPAAVQGASAKKELLRAIRALGQRRDLDAILIFRGGGSRAELAVFNDYEVAKAICLCPLPVLSAIGHQEDLSSAQDVSFKSFGVPKDLGRFFADIINDVRARFSEALQRISAESQRVTADKARDLRHTAAFVISHARAVQQHRLLRLQSLTAAIPAIAAGVSGRHTHRLVRNGQRVLDLGSSACARASDKVLRYLVLPQNAASLFRRAEERLQGLIGLIEAVRPETQLKRGFAIVRGAGDGQFITAASQLHKNDEIEITFHDAAKRALIK